MDNEKNKKVLSEVGFEPTPSFEDQNAHFVEAKSSALESGALDRSAILTYINGDVVCSLITKWDMNQFLPISK